MDKIIQYNRNIIKNYLYILLQNIDFTRGIWMLYLASKGMSLTQLGLLETIFHITSFVMEVPTGAIADILSRKLSRILGRVFSLVGVIILLLGNNFAMFAFSFMFTALSYNLESGAGDALIYDSLKEVGREQDYMKVCGRKEVFYQIAGTISFLVGGYFAVKSYNISFGLTIIIGLINLLQSFTFFEPRTDKSQNKGESGNLLLLQLKDSIKVVRKNPRIGILIIFVETIMAFCTCMFFYLQNYLKSIGYNEMKIGFIYATASMLAAITATQVHRIDRRIGEKGILLIVPIMTVLCIFGAALMKFKYIFFILLTITEGIIFVATNDYINKMIPSEKRATILSFSSMVFSLFMIILFPAIGLIGDRYSLTISFIALGILGTLLIFCNIFALFSLNKNR